MFKNEHYNYSFNLVGIDIGNDNLWVFNDLKNYLLMDGRSLTPTEENLKRLEEIYPSAFVEGKIDWEKLKAILGKGVSFSNERYVLNWAGKSDAFRVLQEPSNETLVPNEKESVNFNNSKNIFIEGENLEVLKILQKSYFGKIKMIYIDPPYNTGSDSFIYPDRFSESKDEYLRRAGEMDEQGFLTQEGLFRTNSHDSGRYHSNWLNMMYPRLFLARNLLSDHGAIFVSIDDHESHNLRLVMNEIFGEENFIACAIWQKVFSPKNTAMYFSDDHEYVLIYAKNKSIWRPELLPRSEKSEARYSNPDNDPRGDWLSGAMQARNYYSKGQYEVESPSGKKYKNPKGTYWRFSNERFLELDKDNRIWWGENGDNVPRLKRFLSEVKSGVVPQTLLLHKSVGHTQEAKEELLKYVDFEHDENVLNSVKPTRLIKHLMQIGSTNQDEIILDFFAGSGPTAHAILDQNVSDNGKRQFILVQLPEPLPKKEKKVKTIADLALSRIRNVIKEKQSEGKKLSELKQIQFDNGFKYFKLSQSNFKHWRQEINQNINELENQMKMFVDPVSDGADLENVVYELLLKTGKDLNSKIENKGNYHCINGNELILILKKSNSEIINTILDEKPKKVIALDRLFKGNDQLKTNTSLQMKEAGIEFKTI